MVFVWLCVKTETENVKKLKKQMTETQIKKQKKNDWCCKIDVIIMLPFQHAANKNQ